MQKENVEKQNQIKKNPTRFNENVNRGENEKSLGQESVSTGAGKNESASTSSNDFVDDLGESSAGSNKAVQFDGGPEAGNYDDEESQQQNLKNQGQQKRPEQLQ